MELTRNQWVLLIGGAIVVGTGVYITVGKTGAPGTNTAGLAPEFERASLDLSMQGVSAKVDALGISAEGGFTAESKFLHFFAPDDSHFINPNCDYKVYTRHRYPTVSGTNINTLIHRGYSALMVPSKRDYDWLANPPADAEFEG